LFEEKKLSTKKISVKQESAIRKRQSYKNWSELHQKLTCYVPDSVIDKIMFELYSFIDDSKGFHTQTNAIYNKESLDLLLKDTKTFRWIQYKKYVEEAITNKQQIIDAQKQ
jgi:hypothetical protein